MPERWLDLLIQPFGKNKKFMKLFFEQDIPNKLIFFNTNDSSYPAEKKSKMTLEGYLKNMTPKVNIRYVIGREETFPNMQKLPAIQLTMFDHFKNHPLIRESAWCFYTNTPKNYEKIDEIFKKIYGVKMANYTHTIPPF